jgi:hypothetical protein
MVVTLRARRGSLSGGKYKCNGNSCGRITNFQISNLHRDGI